MNLDIRFDFQRRERLGLIEAIWGQDKSIDQLKRLSENVLSKNEVVFITRINSEKAIVSFFSLYFFFFIKLILISLKQSQWINIKKNL